MIKYVYKVVILFFVFCGAVFYFGSNIGNNLTSEGKIVEVGEEKFPILTIKTGNNTINNMYGYTGSMDPAIVRQSITPIDSSKSLTLNIAESPVEIQKLHYEVVDKESGEVYTQEDMNALEDGQKKITILFDYAFESSTEYILSLTATMDSGRKVHYFTRLKYYQDDTNLSQKIKFAMDFHDKTFNKESSDELAPYLETDQNQDNSSLAKVDIKSDIDLITWAKLKPEVTSDIVPTIKEYNTETACVLLNYFVKADTVSGEEEYHVKEFYRIRYTSSRYYLLAFERTIESTFNSDYVSTRKARMKIGITQETDMDLMATEDKKNLFFARNGVLYHYNLGDNTITSIYQTFSSNVKKGYALNDENEIRINKIDEEGNVYFTVFGYIPRGEYEGKVAVVLYKYNTVTTDLEELVYMPMNTTYQQLKEDFNTYSYVNSKGIYYFTVGNTVYSYNIFGKRLEKLTEGITDKSFVVLKNKNSLAWSDSLEKGYGETIEIYNLETDEQTQLRAPNANSYIRILGTIDSNVVCGYVRKKDIVKRAEGTEIVPCYRMEIIDTEGKVLKTYKRSSSYVSDVNINGNVLSIERCKKSGRKSYRKISSDSILNQASTQSNVVSLTYTVTSSTLTEWYISLPAIVLTKAPEKLSSVDKVLTAERAVHLEDTKVTKYYVYALGQITGSYENPAEAIQVADEQMGVVISSHHQLVWERGGSFLLNSISGIENVKVSHDITSIGACAYMVLKADHVNVKAKELSESKLSIYDMLAQYMTHPVNLTGANLEQVLYFVSNGKPVIAMTSKNTAVVISEYTQTSVTLINPNSGKTEVVSRSQMAQTFKNAGNKFISYMCE